MKLNVTSPSLPRLRVFPDRPDNQLDNVLVQEQLPFLATLMDQFESVTGSPLAFAKGADNSAQRSIDKSEEVILRQLEIADLSKPLLTGESASHLGKCEQLIATLNQMLHLIQADRKRWQHFDHCLNRVVTIPFDWWGLEGYSGFSGGRMASWSISRQERIRVFTGHLQTETMNQSPLAAAIVLTAFESACQAGLPFTEIAEIIPSVLRKTLTLSSSLCWFSTLELDPITGDYELDGWNADRGVLLIDVQAATAVPLRPSDYVGTIYSGQIFCFGIGKCDAERLNLLLSGQEMTVSQCRQVVESEFNNTASLFLYRR